GIVNPVDDMHEDNAPSHPKLLQELADQFTAHQFDVQYLVRAICNSQTYQRTSKPHGNNEEAEEALFSHMAIKTMPREPLFDSLAQVVGGPENRRGAAAKKPQQQNKKRGPVGARGQFLAFFRTDEGADPTEYQAGIPQALRLMNSPQFSNGAALLSQ